MNIAESASLAIAARERGWDEAESADEADVVLLNTCSVRETAEQRVRGRLAHYASQKKKGKRSFSLILAGCMAERLGENLKKDFPALDFVIGTTDRSLFPFILESLEHDAEKAGAGDSASLNIIEKHKFSFSSLHHDVASKEGGASSFRSFVPIMHGCNNFCTYCIVPYVRGREISRNPNEILEEIRVLGERGVREITLLGQNVNSYLWEGKGGKGKVDFPSLLELIAENLSAGNNTGSGIAVSEVGDGSDTTGVRWVRFLSSHPKDFSPRTIKVIAENSVFCRHIHLCVQHGSNRVLSAMNRQYTREQYMALVSNLRSSIDDISLSTDIMVGFPGETEEDFEEILFLMEEVKFLYSYMYHYNPREGTSAFSLPGRISAEVKRERLSKVISLQKRHTVEQLKSRIGKEVTVLIEGISRKNADELIGRTERDEMVVVSRKAASLGSFVRLRLSSLRGNTFRCNG